VFPGALQVVLRDTWYRTAMVTPRPLRTDEYRRLPTLRTGLRQFFNWSQRQARAEAAGFVERRHDPHDGRVMSLGLTRKDSAALGRLSAQHVEQLARPAEDFRPPWEGPGATDSQLISPVTPGS
jgi:hypothetical protein